MSDIISQFESNSTNNSNNEEKFVNTCDGDYYMEGYVYEPQILDENFVQQKEVTIESDANNTDDYNNLEKSLLINESEEKRIDDLSGEISGESTSSNSLGRENSLEEKLTPIFLKEDEDEEISQEEEILETLLESCLKQSKHLYRDDNVRKATIRGLIQVMKSFILSQLKKDWELNKRNLKKHFKTKRVALYKFFEDIIINIFGIKNKSEILRIYVILIQICIRKKDTLKYLINLSIKEKRMVAQELAHFTKQSKKYTKAAGEFCMKHIVIKIAAKLFKTNEDLEGVFWDQLLGTNKKIGIRNPDKYKKRVLEEVEQVL